MLEVRVKAGRRGYSLSIGGDLLPRAGELAKGCGAGGRLMVITNPVVGQLYLEPLKEGLEQEGFTVAVAEVPDGEGQKTLEGAGRLYGQLLDHSIDRGSTIVTLGGGVIGDLGGFVAATYKRGVPYIQVPTTLLAQVDASIGGKVAVDHPRGKNMIGCFHQPLGVIISLKTLLTLPPQELKAGLAEVIKYGVIRDEELFGYIEAHAGELLSYDMASLRFVVERSCRIKAAVVAEDELDVGPRMILNFGHTLGHALEAATGYRRFRHGEAVAAGMAGAARMALRLGTLSEEACGRIISLIEKVGLPSRVEGVDPHEMYGLLRYDKKAYNGVVRFKVPTRIGEVVISDSVPEAVIRTAIKEMVR